MEDESTYPPCIKLLLKPFRAMGVEPDIFFTREPTSQHVNDILNMTFDKLEKKIGKIDKDNEWSKSRFEELLPQKWKITNISGCNRKEGPAGEEFRKHRQQMLPWDFLALFYIFGRDSFNKGPNAIKKDLGCETPTVTPRYSTDEQEQLQAFSETHENTNDIRTVKSIQPVPENFGQYLSLVSLAGDVNHVLKMLIAKKWQVNKHREVSVYILRELINRSISDGRHFPTPVQLASELGIPHYTIQEHFPALSTILWGYFGAHPIPTFSCTYRNSKAIHRLGLLTTEAGRTSIPANRLLGVTNDTLRLSPKRMPYGCMCSQQ